MVKVNWHKTKITYTLKKKKYCSSIYVKEVQYNTVSESVIFIFIYSNFGKQRVWQSTRTFWTPNSARSLYCYSD